MPRGAKALYVGEQGNDLYIWMLCDPRQEAQERSFLIIATGEDFMPHYKDEHGYHEHHYIGTVQQSNGLVWHVFE